MAIALGLVLTSIVTLGWVAADGECPEIRCLTKLASVAESLCTSHSGLLTYIKPCADPDQFCNEYSGTCTAATAINEAYPGETCSADSTCLGTCKGNTCMGWEELDYCDYQLTCHVGLRCVGHTCIPLIKTGEAGCLIRDDCQNGSICEQGVCTQMYSLPAGAEVSCPRELTKHEGCSSGLCSHNRCLPIPQLHTASPDICERDQDCDTTFMDVHIKGTCQCTFSSFQSVKICTPRITDLQYTDRLALLTEWTSSAAIHLCHRFNSMSLACMRRVWDTEKTKRLLELTIEDRFQISFHLLEPCMELHYLARARKEIPDLD